MITLNETKKVNKIMVEITTKIPGQYIHYIPNCGI